MAVERRRLALDVNFPEPILKVLDDFLVEVELVPVRAIDARLPDLDDRELILALHQEGYDWLVTNNYRMLRNPQELAAILKTHITVFAIEGTGHDPLRATGAVLLDLAGALRRAQPGKVFWSNPRNPDPKDPWELFTTAARHRHSDAPELYESVKVSDEEFARPWREVLGTG